MIVLRGRMQQNIPVELTVTKSDPLAGGVYDIWATVDCYVAISRIDLTADNGYIVFAGNVLPVQIEQGDYIATIAAGNFEGLLCFHQVGG